MKQFLLLSAFIFGIIGVSYSQGTERKELTAKASYSSQDIKDTSDYWYRHYFNSSGEHFSVYSTKEQKILVKLDLSYPQPDNDKPGVFVRTWSATIGDQNYSSDKKDFDPMFSWSDKFLQYQTPEKTVLVFTFQD